MQQVDTDVLTHGELTQLLRCYESAIEALVAMNNTLLDKLQAVPATTNDHMAVLNEWSLIVNGIMEHNTLLMEKTASKVH